MPLTHRHKVLTDELRRGMTAEDIKEIVTVETVKVTPESPTDEQVDIEDDQIDVLDTAYREIKRHERAILEDLQTVDDLALLIAEKWYQGRIDVTKDQYAAFRKNTMRSHHYLLRRAAFMWLRSAQMAGAWTSDVIIDDAEYDVLEHYIDSAFAKHEGRPQTTAEQVNEAKFQTTIERAYGRGPEGQDDMLYCPIAQTLVEHTEAVHLVNANLADLRTAERLFLLGKYKIHDPENGLLLAKEYADLLHSGKAVILPADLAGAIVRPEDQGKDSAGEFILHLLTKDIGSPPTELAWGYDTLHGRRLKFLNKLRPTRTYVLFNAAVTLLLRRRTSVDRDWVDLTELPNVGRELWDSPGPITTKNPILSRFAREVGCLSRVDEDLFWAMDAEAAPVGRNLPPKDERINKGLGMHAAANVIRDLDKK